MLYKRDKNSNEIVKLLSILFTLTFLLSCEGINNNDDSLKDIDCNNLVSGLISKNSDIVKMEIDKLTVGLYPVKSDSDKIGHKNNLDILINRLNTNCNKLTVRLACYACIETNPPQSEILIKTDSLGITIERIVDIFTPENGVLQFGNIH